MAGESILSEIRALNRYLTTGSHSITAHVVPCTLRSMVTADFRCPIARRLSAAMLNFIRTLNSPR
jgi:hypothetical protein